MVILIDISGLFTIFIGMNKPRYILDIESIRNILISKNVAEISDAAGMSASQVYYFLREKPSRVYQNLLRMSELAEKILTGDAEIRDNDCKGRPKKNTDGPSKAASG